MTLCANELFQDLTGTVVVPALIPIPFGMVHYLTVFFVSKLVAFLPPI